MAPNIAAVDNDFLNHLLEIKMHPNLTDLIQRFFSALQVSAVMHPFVRRNEAEVIPNSTRDRLFASGIISEVDVDSLLFSDVAKRRYYSMMVVEIYKDFMGEEYPCQDVLREWVGRKSLGEVHTAVMCALLYYDCFLSDDSDAAKDLQRIIKRRLRWHVNIFNRQNRCEYIQKLPQEMRNNLSRQEIRMLSHS